MTRRLTTIALLAAALTAAFAGPAAAASTEKVSVISGVLTYGSNLGERDSVVIADAGSAWTLVERWTPYGTVGTGCSLYPMGAACAKTGIRSASVSLLDGDDSFSATAGLSTVVNGGDGADTITGGPAADTLNGDAGNDVIDARDGVADVVDCGAGDDRALVDPVDAVSNCEADPAPVVDSAQPLPDTGAQAPGPANPDVALPVALPPVGPATILATAIEVPATGLAPVELTCGADQAGGCRGTVFLDPLPRGKTRKRAGRHRAVAVAARRGRFGSSPFVIASGQRRRVSVSLAPAARRALGLPSKPKRARAARRGRRVKAVVTVHQNGRGKQRAVVELRG